MKKQLSVAIAGLMLAPAFVQADPTLYGKANVSYASTKLEIDLPETNLTFDDESVEELESNASRIGVKGSEEIGEGLKAIYQAEFEIYIDDGSNDDKTFKQRNIFVGIEGGFGTVIAGYFDTPLKAAQKKVDLFNDLYGDIKHVVSVSENRESNSIMYSTPDLNGFRLNADLISSEEDEVSNGTSFSVTYDNDGFYGAIAYDVDVNKENTSTTRGVFQYTVQGFQFGLLAEEFENTAKEKESAIFGSVQYKLNDWAFKAQYGQSDIAQEVEIDEDTAVANDNDTLSFGVDYKLSKATKLFGFYTKSNYSGEIAVELPTGGEVSTDIELSSAALGVGVEVKF